MKHCITILCLFLVLFFEGDLLISLRRSLLRTPLHHCHFISIHFFVGLVVFVEPREVADDVDFVDDRVPPLAVRVVVVVVREAPAVDALGMRELAVLDATVDFAGLARDVVDFGVGTRLVLVVVRLVGVFVVVDVPEASGLPSSLCTDV